MVNLYLVLFLVFLAAYLGSSLWSSLDPAYLIGLALVSFAGAAIAGALGRVTFATVTTEFAFVMILGSLCLALINYVRDQERCTTPRPSAQA
jgi:hypothetical protein